MADRNAVDATGIEPGVLASIAHRSGGAVKVVARPYARVLNVRALAGSGRPLAIDGLKLIDQADAWLGTPDRMSVRLGPDEWLIVDLTAPPVAPTSEPEPADLLQATDVSAGTVVLDLEGPGVRTALGFLSWMDLDSRFFAPGGVAQGPVGSVPCVLAAMPRGVRLLVRRSVAAWLVARVADIVDEAVGDAGPEHRA